MSYDDYLKNEINKTNIFEGFLEQIEDFSKYMTVDMIKNNIDPTSIEKNKLFLMSQKNLTKHTKKFLKKRAVHTIIYLKLL